jgi:hypothetical protein
MLMAGCAALSRRYGLGDERIYGAQCAPYRAGGDVRPTISHRPEAGATKARPALFFYSLTPPTYCSNSSCSIGEMAGVPKTRMRLLRVSAT